VTDEHSNELLPCPFCGGPPETFAAEHGNLRVECMWCDASRTSASECAADGWTRRATPPGELDSAREAHFADLMDLHSACFKNEGEDADEALARMRGLLKERRAALSDMKGKPPHYGPGSGERPQGGIPVQDGG
jgi:hypothetical protein